ncbi:MAG: acyltransferase family protein [Solirubrobacterales bacterium]
MARRGYFPRTDSLRGLGAVAVLIVHAVFFATGGQGSTVEQYLSRLELVVPMFFMLSAFLLFRPFVLAHAEGGPVPGTGGYLARRGLRILPAYWVALTVIALWLGLSGVFTLEGIPVYYGFLQLYGSTETLLGGIAQAWTICVEVSFYLALPFYALGVRRLAERRGIPWLRAQLLGLGALVVISEAYKLIVLLSGARVDASAFEGVGTGVVLTPDPVLSALPASLDQFAIGMAMAVATVAWRDRDTLPGVMGFFDRRPDVVWAVAIVAIGASGALLGLTGNTNQRIGAEQFLGRHLLYTIGAAALLVPSIFATASHGLTGRILASRTLQWLGMISYGFYLWHFAWLVQLDRWGFDGVPGLPAELGWILVGVAGALAFASASWYGLERPFLRIKPRFGRVPYLKTPAPPATGESPPRRSEA